MSRDKDNSGVDFVGTDICMMDSAFNFEYEEFEKCIVDKKCQLRCG